MTTSTRRALLCCPTSELWGFVLAVVDACYAAAAVLELHIIMMCALLLLTFSVV